jgi:hypothetical protein
LRYPILALLFSADTPGGVNFGWRCREGANDTIYATECDGLELTDPITEYDHSEGYSATGGFVYRGKKYPALYGHYFFADYGTGRILTIHSTGEDAWSNAEEELDANLRISAFGEDEKGEL